MERGLPYWFQFGMALSDGRILGIPTTWVWCGTDANAQWRIWERSIVKERAQSERSEFERKFRLRAHEEFDSPGLS